MATTNAGGTWSPAGAETFLEIVRRRASEQCDVNAFTFLPEGEDRELHLTYGELDKRARAIAAELQAKYKAGERVLLLFPPGLEYICAFLGCLYAGMIAVPAYPPRRVQTRRSYTRLETIIRDAQPVAALSLSAVIEKRPAALLQSTLFCGLDWIAADELDSTLAEIWAQPSLTRETLAFLQYTSGSTGDPKGVMVSHGNLLHNEQLMKSAFDHEERTVIVGWLPLFHDMGLVGTVLHPLYIGVRAVLMPPMAFLQRPVRWLRAISKYRATTSGGPNFAFDLCARKVPEEEKLSLDLSSWRVAFNGAEAVHAQTIDRFSEAFAACGFSRKAFFPCYGLAESCLMVSGGEAHQGPVITSFRSDKLEQGEAVAGRGSAQHERAMVSCGRTLGGQQLYIVDPQTAERCPQGRVGEIWIAGPSVAAGYWGRKKETTEVFRATPAGSSATGFLRTGDLGFEHGGELYIAGRLKDLLIFRGQNYYPSDIEHIVQNCHPALQAGVGAAFSIEVEGEERLTIVHETERGADSQGVRSAICEAVAEEFELGVHDIALIRPHTLPRTSSGKTQRYACKQAYLNGTLELLKSAPAQPDSGTKAGETEAGQEAVFISERHAQMTTQLCKMAARILRTGSAVRPNEPLARYGLDSVTAAEISHGIAIEYGIEVDIADVLECRHLAGLAAEIFMKLGDAGSTATASPEIPVEGALYPASQGQQALLFLHRLNPDNTAYNIARALKIRGALDTAALKRAFKFLVNRHVSLRSTFTFSNEGISQQVQPAATGRFLWQEELTDDRNKLAELLRTLARHHFDLEHELPLRVHVIRTDDDEHVLFLAVHHIAVDFWSLAILWKELWAFYAGEVLGQPAVFSPSATYSEFVRRQQEILSGPEGEQLAQFWREQLSGELPVLNLPCDYRRPEIQRYAGAAIDFHLDKKAAEKLRSICARQNATVSMGLLAALQVFLSRYSGQKELVIGVPVMGRKQSAFSGTVGYFVNSVPLRLSLSGPANFANFNNAITQVRAQAIPAFRNSEYPLNVLVEKLGVKRAPDRSPLFDVIFVAQQSPPGLEYLQNFAAGAQAEEIAVTGLALSPMPLEHDTAQFDLSLVATETGAGIAFCLQYNTGLFAPATAQRMARHFRQLLDSLITAPQLPVLETPYLSDAERRQILAEWNATDTDYSGPFTLHDLFVAQVRRTPNATAVKFGNVSLSYSQLNERADALAAHLRVLGVGPDVAVGICIERSPEMVIGLLGILKAGGAYLPLDPTYPAERLAFMIKDSASPVLLTNGPLPCELSSPSPAVIDLGRGEFSGPPVDLPTAGTPENLAYVIYTSGSTGTPKGVMISHRSICNRLFWMQQTYQLTPQDKVLQKTPFSFDVSVWEFFWTLLHGACLVVAPPEAHKDPGALVQIIRKNEITVMHFVPSMLRAFLTAEEVDECDSLRLVVCSGEALPRDLERNFLGRSAARLENLYGPTEAAVDVTYWSCSRSDEGPSVPIGIPIANTQMYILDDHFNPVPEGVSGELYIAGCNLARGYWKRPGLTAERFLPNPFSRTPGERLYRTGDVARFLAGGVIDFLGRADRQVKIRGNRVELGEIESTLLEFPGIREVAVTLRERPAGNFSLVAYFVSTRSQQIEVSQLRSFALEKLPAHEVPAFFMEMESLPLTPSGKLDYRSLPDADAGLAASRHEYVRPVTPEQKILAAVWKEVLGVEKVGIDDGFFELGGDSIRCIAVVANAKENGLRFTIQDMLRHQTIRALAEHIPVLGLETSPEIHYAPYSLVTGEDRKRLPSGVDDAYPMSMLQQGLFFHSEFGADYEIYVTTVLVRSRFVQEQMEEAFRRVVQRHPMLRTSFDVTSYSGPLQLVSGNLHTKVDVRDLRNLPGDIQTAEFAEFTEFTEWLEKEKCRKFDWSKAPLARLTVHLCANGTFHITLSEPFFDGWSAASCLSEILRTYAALLESPEVFPAPPLASSFADFVALEREALESSECQTFWEQTLEDCTFQRLPALEGQNTAGAALIGRIQINVPEETAEQLRRISREFSVPLKSVLLAAHIKVMSLLSGSDVLTGILANGRPEKLDGDKVLGVHLSALPFRVRLKGKSWRELVRQVLETERELLPHRRYPIAELQRQRSRQPLFEAVFNFTHFHAYSHVREESGIEILDGYASEQTYFPLTVHCNIDHATAAIRWALDYNSHRFSEAQARRYADYHLRVLEAIAADPLASYEQFLPLSPVEREQTGLWNATESEYDHNLLIHELFEMQVASTPDAPAVQDATRCFSYRELEVRSNQLARRLRKLGVGPDAIVGICLERVVELGVAYLAVLKAGGAWLAIDPAVPENRISFMLQDAGASVVVIQDKLRPLFASYSGHMLLVDSDWEDIATESGDKPGHTCDSENLAYVLYTSGSTGVPKGVQITHRGAVNTLLFMERQPGLGPTDTVLSLTSVSFDMFVVDIYLPLIVGAKLVFGTREVARDGYALREALRRSGATLFQGTPATWQLLVTASHDHLGPMKLLSAGDVLPCDVTSRLMERGCSVFNLYGTTETAVYTCLYEATPESVRSDSLRRGWLGTGRPIANTQVHIVNSELQPMPVGAPGEIVICGDGPARGYLNRPELTAERFVPDPFSKTPGARMYRAGDQGCWLVNGELEFMGRLDHQVKIRGFRVEPGETETILNEHPAVHQAAVIAREHGPQHEKILAAYIVPASNAECTVAELRSFLSARVPAQQVPTAFVFMDALPLTSSGKINRRALPAPDQDRPAMIENYVAPRNATEEKIVEVWQEVLRRKPIGIFDNFFDLGGHSLLATQIVARLRVIFQVELPLPALFDKPTVAGLSDILQSLCSTREDEELAGLVEELEQLSDEEVRLRLSLPFPALNAETLNVPVPAKESTGEHHSGQD